MTHPSIPVPVALMEDHKGKVGALELQRTQLLIALRDGSGCCGLVRLLLSILRSQSESLQAW